jgi:hypothetical protein
MTDLDILRQQAATILQVIENEQQTRAIAEQTRAEVKQLQLETERMANLQSSHRGRLLAIPELNRRGFRFTWQEEGKVGQECSRISRQQFKDEPGSVEHQREWHGVMCNTYLPPVLDEWINQHGHRYTRLK